MSRRRIGKKGRLNIVPFLYIKYTVVEVDDKTWVKLSMGGKLHFKCN